MFALESIVVEQAGRYECAYGTKSPDRLGDFQTNNSVSIRVKESQILLILQVQNLTEGVEVTFICSLPKDSKIKSSSGGSFELHRDGELLSLQSADTSPEVTFRIPHTSENNNGSYVCVFRMGDVYRVKSPPVRLQHKETYFLPNVIRLILSAMVGLVLLFLLCDACGNKR
ncbi:Fc receptor-like A [Polypterus senegalus]|uniref:Fc receptor-like A n=1 Tax=Polypterus senegalus TaxID=55291 RepID=UPI0019644162|nr:Fc receptor-like A [Polypterus senegalus]